LTAGMRYAVEHENASRVYLGLHWGALLACSSEELDGSHPFFGGDAVHVVSDTNAKVRDKRTRSPLRTRADDVSGSGKSTCGGCSTRVSVSSPVTLGNTAHGLDVLASLIAFCVMTSSLSGS
jgi:hypothetical protein